MAPVAVVAPCCCCIQGKTLHMFGCVVCAVAAAAAAAAAAHLDLFSGLAMNCWCVIGVKPSRGKQQQAAGGAAEEQQQLRRPDCCASKPCATADHEKLLHNDAQHLVKLRDHLQ
jgi:hypothetical protein